MKNNNSDKNDNNYNNYNKNCNDNDNDNDNEHNDFIENKDFIDDEKEYEKNPSRDSGTQKTRSPNEQNGRKLFFNAVLGDKVNQTPRDLFRTEVKVDLSVCHCEKELRDSERHFTHHVGTAMLFTNLSEEPRSKLHSNFLPANAKYDHVEINFPGIIPHREHLQYLYYFKTAYEFLKALGDIVKAGTYAQNSRKMVPSGFHNS